MKAPRFWYESPAGWLDHVFAWLSRPLGPVYAALGARRIRTRTPHRSDAAIICVGNLTLGGTGKTPVTIRLLQQALAREINAQALSRGYGGRLEGPVNVDAARHSARDVGDEPLMIAATAPVWISRHRIHGAEAARQNGADLIIMDDGHQNPDLHKDISIVVVDGEAGWGNGRVFPAGPLREPVTQGLNRADAVILMVPHEGFEPDYDGLHLAELEIPVLKAWLEPANPAPTDPVLAFAGIGRPEKFFHSLSAAGAKLTDTRSFPDHHAYSASDLAKLRKAADQLSSQLITTEKDLVRIPPEHRETILAWPVKAEFSEPARLTALIQEALDAAAARR